MRKVRDQAPRRRTNVQPDNQTVRERERERGGDRERERERETDRVANESDNSVCRAQAAWNAASPEFQHS